MSNVFCNINYKGNLKQFVRLISNICQYKLDNIILPNSILCMPYKNKMLIFYFTVLQIITTREQTFFNMSINPFLIGHFNEFLFMLIV